MRGRQFEVPVLPAPELSIYRDRTIALLRRYFRLSCELGRLPSVLGREIFRAKVTSYRMHTFEDVVIFVHDMERCVEKLDAASRELLSRIVLQEYTHDETATLLGCTRRTVERRYPVALDRLTAVLLHYDLLRDGSCGEGVQEQLQKPERRKPAARATACQGAQQTRLCVIG